MNHFKTDELSKVDIGLNGSYLVQLLEGTKYNRQLLDINYDRISHRVEDFVEGIWFRWENGSTKYYNKTSEHDNLFPRSFTGFWRAKFYNCYGMDVPMTMLRKESNVYIEEFFYSVKQCHFCKWSAPSLWRFCHISTLS